MPSLDELLNQIQESYSVILLEDKGTTAGGKVKEYDLWYDDNGIVRYKRIHIFDDGKGNYQWYSENPIPRAKTTSFMDEVRNEIDNRISKMENAVYYEIDRVDEQGKRALVTIFIDDGTSLKTKKAFIKKNKDETWDFRLRDFSQS